MESMKTFVFIGSTIEEREARQWLDAVYLPPATQGDILGLLRHEPKIIGIIDGSYDNTPAVWHKEILLALERGIQVVGASSMGALRAAELHTFGMIGVGEIFESYRDGLIEADDEVAVHHAGGEYGYRALSEALVNIRKTLQMAQAQGIIQPVTHQALIEIERRTPFWQRSYAEMLKLAAHQGLPPEELACLEAFLNDHRINQKKLDAIRALQLIASLQAGEPGHLPGVKVQRTIYLDGLEDRDLPLNRPGDVRLTPADIANHIRLRREDFSDLQCRAASSAALLVLARFLDLVASPGEVSEEREKLRQKHGSTGEEIQNWMQQSHLTQDELTHFIEQKILLNKVLALFAAPSNRDLLRQLRLEGNYEAVAQSALDSEIAFVENLRVQEIDPVELAEFFGLRSGRKIPASLEEFAQQSGFDDRANLIVELQKFYAHETQVKTDPQSD